MNEAHKSNIVELNIRSFEGQILHFNGMYKLPVAPFPQLDAVYEDEIRRDYVNGNSNKDPISRRLDSFHQTLLKELVEVEDIQAMMCSRASAAEILTAIADWLGDIIIYCASEMAKYGIPQKEVLRIIMSSNFSKLQADGSVKYDEHGKVEKGPGYWKPEPLIKDLLLSLIEDHNKGKTNG